MINHRATSIRITNKSKLTFCDNLYGYFKMLHTNSHKNLIILNFQT